MIREKTGLGDKTIEHLSTVFDGGIGMSGGVCGALTGGVIALGLQFGYEHSKEDAFKMRDIFRTIPRKFSKISNKFIDKFIVKYGSFECEGIAKGKFKGFEDYLKQREKCQELIDWVVEEYL